MSINGFDKFLGFNDINNNKQFDASEQALIQDKNGKKVSIFVQDVIINDANSNGKMDKGEQVILTENNGLSYSIQVNDNNIDYLNQAYTSLNSKKNNNDNDNNDDNDNETTTNNTSTNNTNSSNSNTSNKAILAALDWLASAFSLVDAAGTGTKGLDGKIDLDAINDFETKNTTTSTERELIESLKLNNIFEQTDINKDGIITQDEIYAQMEKYSKVNSNLNNNF